VHTPPLSMSAGPPHASHSVVICELRKNSNFIAVIYCRIDFSPMARTHSFSPALPIDAVLPALDRALAARPSVVLQAPPGAGKTTRVPLALLDASWLDGQRIVMLEPRRLATRAAARRMAATLGERVGQTVGFRVRGESRISHRTRIEVVTEGVLTKMLQSDPTLDGIGLVMFDEFHERHLQGDLGLALSLQTQELLRPSLRLLVMSATLDGAAVSALLGGAPIVTSDGRSFPVAVRYVARRDDQRVEGAVAAAIVAALARDGGSVLAFLPGAAEIRRSLALLERAALPGDVELFPLFGDLSAAAQDAAIAPAAEGRRKVVLATSIAETSLTIEGIRIVVDSGIARVPRFSPRTGMARLETVRVSRAAATQRAGRAGRVAPGVVYRLWREDEDAHLLEQSTPEIVDADLTALALDLAAAGVSDPRTLRWIDPPPAAALGHARRLLHQLGALGPTGGITTHGSAIAALGLHPRFAHMLVRGRDLDAAPTACALAALLDERDIMRRDAPLRDADIATRVMLVAGDGDIEATSADRDVLRRVRERVRVLREQLGVPDHAAVDTRTIGWLLALAYPDRIGERRSSDGGRYLLRSGFGAVLPDPGALTGAPFLVVAELDGRLPHARIYLAAALDRADLLRVLADQVESEDVVAWDADAGAVRMARVERLGAIMLKESPLRGVDDDRIADVVLDAIAREDDVALVWSDAARRLRERIGFLRHLDPRWPDVTGAALRATLSDWLRPHLRGVRRRSDIERLDLAAIVLETLDWQQRAELDRLAPTHVVVPTGSRVPVDYADPEAPSIAVRLQELFGLAVTPAIAGGRVPLVLQLLSPAHRPVQVTRDLVGFWRTSYFAVRKDLRGRYPKHEWPEDPMRATPTRRAKPRGT
jgi:ATP-dependent helicase HrpB